MPVAAVRCILWLPMHDTISVSDIPRPASARLPLPSPSLRRQTPVVRGVTWLACVDSLVPVAAIVGVLISVNLPHMSGDLDSFLSARITVKNLLLLILLAGAWPCIFSLFGLYDAARVKRFRSEARLVVEATSIASSLAVVFPLTSVSGSFSMGDLLHFWLGALVLSLLVRTGRQAIDRARHGEERRVLIVGTGPLARRAFTDIRVDRPHRYQIVGFVDDPGKSAAEPHAYRIDTIGSLDQLEQILMREVIDEVVIALPVKSCYQQIQYTINVCERAGVQAKYGAHMFESTVASPRYNAEGDWAFVAMHVVPDGYRLTVKRAIDIVGAVVGLVVLSPVMLIVAIAIKVTSRGPIIYAQDRCGLNKRPLRMYKFRSMFADADKLQAALEELNEASGPVFKIREDPRITPVGRLLRKSSLDELPQLWNVLRGDMSLVGPRPLPWRDVRRIIRPSDMRRFSMRPGLTCLWQVQGRSNLDFQRWVELDLQYIDTWSLTLDLRILLKTIPAVLSGNGAT